MITIMPAFWQQHWICPFPRTEVNCLNAGTGPGSMRRDLRRNLAGTDIRQKVGSYQPCPRRAACGLGEISPSTSPSWSARHHRKISSIEQIDQKDGASGALFIVTIRHRLFDEDDDLCVDEVQNLVYRDDPDPNAPPQQFPLAPGNAETTREFKPDSTLLFRYSALTFNGHRIHYDLDYARKVEGYSNLVLHAPLSATLLCHLGNEQLSDVPLRSFHYRATAPVFCGETVRLCARGNGNRVQLWIEKTGGIQAMISTAEG